MVIVEVVLVIKVGLVVEKMELEVVVIVMVYHRPGRRIVDDDR